MKSVRSLVYLAAGANAWRVFCRDSGLVQGEISVAIFLRLNSICLDCPDVLPDSPPVGLRFHGIPVNYQFSDGFSARSITRISTGPLCDSSLRPSCSRKAV